MNWNCSVVIRRCRGKPSPASDTKELLREILDKQKEIAKDIAEIKANERTVDNRLRATENRLGQLDEISKMIIENKNKLANVEVTVTSLEKTIELQQQRLSNLEDRERRNNMIVFSIPEANNETAADLEQKVIRDIFFGQLGVTVTSVERIHRLGPKRHNKNRPIILRVYNYNEKQLVFKNCRKLKNTLVIVSDDYSKKTVEKRRQLWNTARQEKRNGDKVRLVYDKLFVNDVAYVRDSVTNTRVQQNVRVIPMASQQN